MKMKYYITTISKYSPDNWDKCKQYGIWGLPRWFAFLNDVQPGDESLVWLSGEGFIARCRVLSNFFTVTGGGKIWGDRDYPYRIKFEVMEEFSDPKRFRFRNNRMDETNIAAGNLRWGFYPITLEQFRTVIGENEPKRQEIDKTQGTKEQMKHGTTRHT